MVTIPRPHTSLWQSLDENLGGPPLLPTLRLHSCLSLARSPSAGCWTVPQLPCKWFPDQTGQAGGFMKPLPQGLGWGPANICKPLVWSPLEQMCLFSKNRKDSIWKQSFILTGMHPGLAPHFPCLCPRKARYAVWPNLEKQFAVL